MKPVMFVGESWFTHSIHQKGFDTMVTSEYAEGATVFLAAMRSLGHEVDYVPSHEVQRRFPTSPQDLARYGAVALSDVGTNTFLLTHATFALSETVPNRLIALAQFVEQGGGIVMIGGYMSFSGIDGRARYGQSPLAPVLPVVMQNADDRVERPEGAIPRIVEEHPILSGLPRAWPAVLGYNKVQSKADATILAVCSGSDDPLLVVGTYGKGRTVAFMSDLAPHWAPPGFIEWEHYPRLWSNILTWASGTGS